MGGVCSAHKDIRYVLAKARKSYGTQSPLWTESIHRRYEQMLQEAFTQQIDNIKIKLSHNKEDAYKNNILYIPGLLTVSFIPTLPTKINTLTDLYKYVLFLIKASPHGNSSTTVNLTPEEKQERFNQIL